MPGTRRRDFLRSAAVALAGVGGGGVLATATAVSHVPTVGPDTCGPPPGPSGGGVGRLRGLMVDAARLPEKPSHYRRLIDFCRDWDVNALLFRLTDDQGSALRFASHPEIVTHPHALTPDEARALAEYGERQGVTLIPEIESFGHTSYITRVPRWAHLEDRNPSGGGFTALDPLAPESLALIGDLYREVAAIFPSPYLHGGCDEVNWGGSERSRRALASRTRPQIWADHVNALADLCGRLDRELIVWGDAVARGHPDILPRLDKRVVVMDWQYHVTEPGPLRRLAEHVMDRGLRVIGAPAAVFCEWGPRVGERQLRNIDAFADAYAGLCQPRCLGVIVTNWVPTRYLANGLWDTYAYAATALERGSGAARQSAFPRFVETFYEAPWSAAWQQVFDLSYRIAPARQRCAPGRPAPRLLVPWATEADLRGVFAAPPVSAPPYPELRERLRSAHDSVRRNAADFSTFALATEYLGHTYWREAAVAEARSVPTTRSLGGLLKTIADRDRAIVDKLDADWSAARFADDPARRAPLYGLTRADQLVLQMRRAADFSAELVRAPERLRRMLV